MQRLSELVFSQGFHLVFVPTSFQSRQLIVDHGLTLGDLERNYEIDVTIDGADEVDRDLNCIKGGGGCLTQEKIVASCSRTFVVIADDRKDSDLLGVKWTKGVPIEVIPYAYKPVMKKIEALGGQPVLRMAVAKMGPLVTDNGMFIVDAHFGAIDNPHELNQKLLNIAGVVETGLFIGMAERVFFGRPDDGSVYTKDKKK